MIINIDKNTTVKSACIPDNTGTWQIIYRAEKKNPIQNRPVMLYLKCNNKHL